MRRRIRTVCPSPTSFGRKAQSLCCPSKTHFPHQSQSKKEVRGEAYVAGLTLPNLGIPLGQRPPELWKGHTKRKCGWTCVLQLDLELMLEWLKTFREVRMR